MKKLVNLGFSLTPQTERNAQTSTNSGLSSAIDGIRGYFVKDDGEHRIIISTAYGTGTNKRVQTAFVSCDNMDFIAKLQEVVEQKGYYFSLQGQPSEFGNVTNEQGDLVELPASIVDGFTINDTKMGANCRFTVIPQYSLEFNPDYDGEMNDDLGLFDVDTLDFSYKKGVPFAKGVQLSETNEIVGYEPYLFFVTSRGCTTTDAKLNRIGNRENLIKALNADIGLIELSDGTKVNYFTHIKEDYLTPEDGLELLQVVYSATSTAILEGLKDGKFGKEGEQNAILDKALQTNVQSLPTLDISNATIANVKDLVTPYKAANRLDLLQGIDKMKVAVKAAYNNAIK